MHKTYLVLFLHQYNKENARESLRRAAALGIDNLDARRAQERLKELGG